MNELNKDLGVAINKGKAVIDNVMRGTAVARKEKKLRKIVEKRVIRG